MSPVAMPPVRSLRVGAQQPFQESNLAAAFPIQDENDCSSSNKHALAIQSLDKLGLGSSQTPADPRHRGKLLRAGRPRFIT